MTKSTEKKAARIQKKTSPFKLINTSQRIVGRETKKTGKNQQVALALDSVFKNERNNGKTLLWSSVVRCRVICVDAC